LNLRDEVVLVNTGDRCLLEAEDPPKSIRSESATRAGTQDDDAVHDTSAFVTTKPLAPSTREGTKSLVADAATAASGVPAMGEGPAFEE